MQAFFDVGGGEPPDERSIFEGGRTLSFCSNDATVISSLVEAHPVRRAAIEHSPSVDLQPQFK
jgi:hypothetical protein